MVNKLMEKWRVEIAQAIQRKWGILQHKMKINSTKSMNIYPYMRLLTPEEYTDILLDEMKSLGADSELYSPTVIQIYDMLGQKVMHKYQMKLREQNGVNEKILSTYKTYREILCSGHCPDNPRQLWQRIVHHSRDSGPCINQRDIEWPWSVRCEIGQTLFKILLENIKIDVNLLTPARQQANYIPLLYTLFRKRECISREEVRVHPIFAQLIREAKLDTMKFKANEAPMVCPPMPWTTCENGGYLHSLTHLLRLPPQFGVQNDMLKNAPVEQLYPPLDALNQLGSIPWRVNTRILDLAIKIFNLGGDLKLDVPLTPDNMLTDEQLVYRKMTRKELVQSLDRKDNAYQQRQNEILSLYTDTLYKLSLANHYRDQPFWLPTNMDFRGRSYPGE